MLPSFDTCSIASLHPLLGPLMPPSHCMAPDMTSHMAPCMPLTWLHIMAPQTAPYLPPHCPPTCFSRAFSQPPLMLPLCPLQVSGEFMRGSEKLPCTLAGTWDKDLHVCMPNGAKRKLWQIYPMPKAESRQGLTLHLFPLCPAPPSFPLQLCLSLQDTNNDNMLP